MTSAPHTRRPERGAALLLVLMVVAIVTVLATELAYDTRVSLQIAANARDELRASYQARGAVALSRLVLHFQARLDQAGGAASQFIAGASAAVGGQAASPVPQGSFSFRLWDAIPVDSTAMGLLLGTGSAGGTGAARARRRARRTDRRAPRPRAARATRASRPPSTTRTAR